MDLLREDHAKPPAIPLLHSCPATCDQDLDLDKLSLGHALPGQCCQQHYQGSAVTRGNLSSGQMWPRAAWPPRHPSQGCLVWVWLACALRGMSWPSLVVPVEMYSPFTLILPFKKVFLKYAGIGNVVWVQILVAHLSMSQDNEIFFSEVLSPTCNFQMMPVCVGNCSCELLKVRSRGW